MTNLTELIKTLAWYNGQVNTAMAKILDSHQELLAESGSTYFGSLLDMLRHIYNADITWLTRLSQPGGPRLKALEAGLLSEDSTYQDWRTQREALDQDLQTFCGSLTDEVLNSQLEYRNSRGELFVETCWKALLHLFNHQTHHRGQIAQVLDEHEIGNDYSNLIWYLRESGL